MLPICVISRTSKNHVIVYYGNPSNIVSGGPVSSVLLQPSILIAVEGSTISTYQGYQSLTLKISRAVRVRVRVSV